MRYILLLALLLVGCQTEFDSCYQACTDAYSKQERDPRARTVEQS